MSLLGVKNLPESPLRHEWWRLPLSTVWLHLVNTMWTGPLQVSSTKMQAGDTGTRHLPPAAFPGAAFCVTIFLVIMSSSLNALFVLAGLVWSVKVNILGVWVGRGPCYCLEVPQHSQCCFSLENLSLSDLNLHREAGDYCFGTGLCDTTSYVVSPVHVSDEATRTRLLWALLCSLLRCMAWII